MIIASVRPEVRIASIVEATGMPYRSPAQPSSTTISSSRRSRSRPMSSAVRRATRVTWSRVLWIVADASMPSTRRGLPPASWRAANPAIMPAWVEPVTVQTTMVSKNTSSSRSCAATSYAQFANPRPPSRCSLAPAGMP